LKRALIFGANGQDGYYLNKLLQLNKIEVVSISRTFGSILGDVADFEFVENIIKDRLPNYVFHFAANSTTKHTALLENHASISSGTLNILEAVKKHSPSAKIFISGSAMQFKNDELPINENTPFESSSAYSAERIYSVYLSRYYREKFNLNTYVGYLFNHDSPLRSENHINQKIVMSAINIANGNQDKLIIGDFDVKKEFNYAGDIVTAIWQLVSQNEVSEMVIGSGVAYDIRIWIEYCFNKLGLKWEEHTIKDEKYVTDYNILVSDPKLLMSTGWKPTKNIFQLAELMLNSAIEKQTIK
jgi:GDPmannose 4,6-dehydratase